MHGHKKSFTILDELEIYLHPDLQKKLLRIVRDRFGQFFMATHSVEIINEAAPGDVIAIHPSAKAGKRVLTDEDYQALFNYIGSFENIDFSRLGRARRLVFFEGNDKKLLRRYAEKLGAMNFALDLDTTILQSGGFGQWRRVKETAWTFREVLKLEVDIFALFDRDYRSQEEVDKFLDNMNSQGIKCFVLQRKEIENYVLTRDNLVKVIRTRQEQRLPDNQWLSIRQIDRLINAVSNNLRHDTASQIAAQRLKYFQQNRSSIDAATISKDTALKLERAWKHV